MNFFEQSGGSENIWATYLDGEKDIPLRKSNSMGKYVAAVCDRGGNTKYDLNFLKFSPIYCLGTNTLNHKYVLL